MGVLCVKLNPKLIARLVQDNCMEGRFYMTAKYTKPSGAEDALDSIAVTSPTSPPILFLFPKLGLMLNDRL